jgi:hypothetical protein
MPLLIPVVLIFATNWNARCAGTPNFGYLMSGRTLRDLAAKGRGCGLLDVVSAITAQDRLLFTLEAL